MGYNKDLITPLLLYSSNYTTTSHTLTQCNSKESSNDEQTIQSRWNPTREQMMALEEVYRSGTRTPTTQQIQELASKLKKYGRIEGKNVFYWFQNHKSRERLKRSRPNHHQEQRLATNNVHDQEPLRKDNLVDSSVLRRRGDHRVIHTKSFLSSSPTHPQKNNNNDGDGKIMEEYERGLVEEKETWQNQLDPINSLDCTYQMVITSKGSQEAEHQYHNLNEEEEEETRKNRTLDLFPVTENQEKTDVSGFEEKRTKPNRFCSNYYCYYEFMPLMN